MKRLLFVLFGLLWASVASAQYMGGTGTSGTPGTTSINSGTGITVPGSPCTTTCNINFSNIVNATWLGNISGGSAAPIPLSLSQLYTYLSVLPVANIPVATSSTFGAVKPDNTTVTISSGILSAPGGATPGGSVGDVQYNNTTFGGSAGLTFDGFGQLTVGQSNIGSGEVVFNNVSSLGQTILVPTAGMTGTAILTMPPTTDTIVGRATADTLLNKTINGAVLSGTLSGTPTYSGVPIYTGLSSGSIVAGSYLGLDSGNHVILGAGGTGAVSVTQGTPNIVITPTPGTGTFTVGSTIVTNPQTGTTYNPVVTGDNTKDITFSNASPIAITLPQAGSTGFAAGWSAQFYDIGAGTSTITTTTSTIMGGGQTLLLPKGTGAFIDSDGTNWNGIVGVTPYDGNTAHFLSGAGTWLTPAGGVSGPGSSTSHALVTWNGTGGATLESLLTVFTVSTTTITAGSTGILDMSAAAPTAGLKLPSAAGAIPTADGFISVNTTTHALVTGSNGNTIVQAAAATGTNTSTACNAGSGLVSTISAVAVPSCRAVNLSGGDVANILPNASVAAAPLPTPGSGATLVAPRSYYICTTTCSITLPTPAAGDEFCVRNDTNVSTVITFAAISGVQFENTNFTSYKTANTSIVSGGAAGDKLCVLGRDATHYLVASFIGTWS